MMWPMHDDAKLDLSDPPGDRPILLVIYLGLIIVLAAAMPVLVVLQSDPDPATLPEPSEHDAPSLTHEH